MTDAAAPANSRPLLEVHDIHKRFGANEVLKGVSLQARAGDVISLIGSSGSGKSSLLRCIAGLLPPQTGELYPAELSGGMKKRVGLARAIATQPEIIFFDEPTTGLDPIMSDVINDLIVECVHVLGASALSITHDMASCRKIANRVAMLYQGKIIWDGPVAEIDHSNNPFVDQFIHGRAEGPIRMQIPV